MNPISEANARAAIGLTVLIILTTAASCIWGPRVLALAVPLALSWLMDSYGHH
jgi:hypothetical protein